MKKYLLVAIVVLITASFKSTTATKACWRIYDYYGNYQQGEICGKTEAEMTAQFSDKGYLFHNATEPVFCWQIEAGAKTLYIRNKAQDVIDKLFAIRGWKATKTDCNSFCIWKYQDKKIKKGDTAFVKTFVLQETIVGEKCKTIVANKYNVIKETKDSLFYRTYLQAEN